MTVSESLMPAHECRAHAAHSAGIWKQYQTQTYDDSELDDRISIQSFQSSDRHMLTGEESNVFYV